MDKADEVSEQSGANRLCGASARLKPISAGGSRSGRGAKPVAHPVAGARIYEELRRAILHGRYLPGERLTEVELATEFSVSRTPVREAIRQLAVDGLIELLPHRGAVVRVAGTEDVREIFDLRAVLEGYCARQAALHMPPDQVRDLEVLLQDQRHIAVSQRAETRVAALIQENLKFHRAIVAGSGNRRADAFIRNLAEIPVTFRSRFWDSDARRESALAYHREIVAAIRSRDPDRAEAAMKAHVYSAKDYFLEEMAAQTDLEVRRSGHLSRL